MKNNSKSISSFGKKLSKSQLLSRLAKKNLKGGGAIGCPPPIGILNGNNIGCPPPIGIQGNGNNIGCPPPIGI